MTQPASVGAAGGTRYPTVAAVLVTVTFFGLLVVWPLASVFQRSLADVGPDRLVDILGRGSVRKALFFTVWQSFASAALTLAIGLPIAHAIARYQFWGRKLIRVVAVVPFVLPTVVVGAAIEAAFSRVGLSLGRSVLAILAAHVFFNVAIVIRVVGGFWAGLDQSPVAAARVLGASPFAAFRWVTLPRLMPSIVGAGVLVFLFSFTSFGVILILGRGGRATLETEIYRNAIFRQEFDVAAVLALVQLLVVAVLSLFAARFQRRHATAQRGRDRRGALPLRTAGQRLHVFGIILLVVGVIGIPVLALVDASLQVGGGYGFGNYRNLLDKVSLLPVSPARSMFTSLWFALIAALIAAVVGLLAAFAVVRAGRVGSWLETLALIPLGVSAVTLGFGYLLAFTVFDLRRSPWLIPLAHAVVGVPFVLASVVPALRGIDDRFRQAAAALGAPPGRVLLLIDWPLIRRAAFTGAGFAFAVSLGEFGATTFLSRGEESFTAPLAIFRLLSQPGDLLRGQALALSVLIGLMVAGIAAILERGRGEEVGLL